MGRTGHSSTDGVRAYKRTSKKLKELTSDVLNGNKTPIKRAVCEPPARPKLKQFTSLTSKETPQDSCTDSPVCEQPEQPPMKRKKRGKENENPQPIFQISGGSHFTININ